MSGAMTAIAIATIYVFVAPQNAATLRHFAMIILMLAPIAAQESPPSFPTGGISNSPTIGAGIC